MLCVGGCFTFFFLILFFLPSSMKEQRWTVNFVVWQWQCCKQKRHVTTSLAAEAPWRFREQSLGLWVSTSTELTRCWSITGLRAVTMRGQSMGQPIPLLKHRIEWPIVAGYGSQEIRVSYFWMAKFSNMKLFDWFLSNFLPPPIRFIIKNCQKFLK